jgi:mannosyltransferase OCH1-like enzyme
MGYIIILLLVVLLLLLLPERSNFDEGAVIPKIIHQTAPADKSKWHQKWAECQTSWLEKFPGWEYKMWTDEDLDEFIKTKHPEFLETYQGYPKNINRIDAARYYILFDYGGMYADMDFMCLQNFEDQLPLDKVSIAESMQYRQDIVQNALMVSPKGHPFWEKVHSALEECKMNVNIGVGETTGPWMLSKVVSENIDQVNILPDDGVYSSHLGTATWL